MGFSYDYFPYNDTIAAGLYDNLYVRIFGIQSSLFGPNCRSWVIFGSPYSLGTFQGSTYALDQAILTTRKGAGNCIDQCKDTSWCSPLQVRKRAR